MKHRNLIPLLVVAAVLAGLAGCASTTTTPPQTTPPITAPSTTMPPPAATTLPVTAAPPTTTALPATTMPPSATISPAAVTSTAGGNIIQVTLTAQNIAFDKSTITVPAGSDVIMTFVNMDSGVPHNFALYTDLHTTTPIFVGDFIYGVKTVTYRFKAPSSPGSYFFRCDVHPEMMTGTFAVV